MESPSSNTNPIDESKYSTLKEKRIMRLSPRGEKLITRCRSVPNFGKTGLQNTLREKDLLQTVIAQERVRRPTSADIFASNAEPENKKRSSSTSEKTNNTDLLRSWDVDDKVDRTWWLKAVLDGNPYIREVRERVKPLNRAICFGKTYTPGRKQVKERLDKNLILQIIMQHLIAKGKLHAVKTLEKESGVVYNGPKDMTSESRLVTFLKQAIKDTERVYDLAIGDKPMKPSNMEVPGVEHSVADLGQINSNISVKTQKDSILSEVEEHLFDLGLLEEASEQDEEDENIWLTHNPDHIIIEKDSDLATSLVDSEEEENVKAGTLGMLVEKLTHESKPDLGFMKTFLMTYQSFCTPKKLFEKLKQRYYVPDSFRCNDDDRNDVCSRIRLRVCSVLKTWLQEYPSDFDEELKRQVRAFVQEMRNNNEAALAAAISTTLSRESSYRQEKTFSQKPPEPLIPKNIFSSTLDFVDIEEEEFARQICLLEFEIFSEIKAAELLNQAWSKTKLKHKAQNVLALIERFNILSVWVGTRIVATTKLKQRVKILHRFIKLAKHLRNLNNFNSLMAIIAGLNFASIHRLKHTWDALPVGTLEIYQELEKVMSSEGAFTTYRETLKAAHGPKIPYLGVHLTDLIFIDENAPYIEHKGTQLINIAKRKLIYGVISSIQQMQQNPYNLQPVHQILHLLKYKLTQMDEQSMYKASLLIEPRKCKVDDLL